MNYFIICRKKKYTIFVIDLTFCFQAGIILNEALKKAEYIDILKERRMTYSDLLYKKTFL